MKKIIKQTILALATITCLSLMPLVTQNVNAIGAGAALGAVVGSGLNTNDKDATSSGRESQKRMSGGASAAKTGFFLTVSVAPSINAPSRAIGHGAVLRTKSGYKVPAQFTSSCASQSRIPGASVVAYGVAPWSWPAFRLEGAAGYGDTTASWLMAKASNGNSNAFELANFYCGVTEQEIRQHINNNEIVFLYV